MKNTCLAIIELNGSDAQTDRRPEAEPTGRIEQHYVLSGVDAAFLHERCSYLLRPLVKLHAGGCADRYTLKGQE